MFSLQVLNLFNLLLFVVSHRLTKMEKLRKSGKISQLKQPFNLINGSNLKLTNQESILLNIINKHRIFLNKTRNKLAIKKCGPPTLL